MLFALVVDDTLGWLPHYLRAFVLVSGLAGALLIVNLRALEPLTRPWLVASGLVGLTALGACLPGIWLAVRAEDLPIPFAGPFVLLGIAGGMLLNFVAQDLNESA
ncbi:MAG: hypothetical protein EP330_17505 [Deltaproteobacteria bacterium]|nr:MAG: hypothetical protein EP330_17505 [Deltaproteobacteria bacterium]